VAEVVWGSKPLTETCDVTGWTWVGWWTVLGVSKNEDREQYERMVTGCYLQR